MVNVSAGNGEVSVPPPLSCSCTETVATPLAFAAGVNVSVPLDEIAGCTENRLLLLLLTRNVNVCVLSLAGPGEMPVAQLETICGPASSPTTTSGPPVNTGGSLTALTVNTNV